MTKTGEAARPQLDLDDHAENAFEWAKKHSRDVGIGVIIAVAIAGGAYLWRASSERKEANAGRSLSEAQQSFTSGNLPLATSDLQKVIQRYDGTMSAKQARLLLAQALYQQDKVADGLKALDGIGSPGPLAASVHAVRASGLEQSGKPAEAAAEFLQASQAALSEIDKASYRADAARSYLAAGKKDEAVKIWKELATDETSPISAEAKLRLGELTAQPAKG
jgi:predicted negative regulator of RcsB-dependent stress response